MASAVRIESEAFTDPRFKVLGKRLGIDQFSALARMAQVWSHCTQAEAYWLPHDEFDALFDIDGAADAAVKSRLADAGEGDNEGLIRVRGTRGRIEWKAKLRKNSKKGGAARKAKAKPKGSQKASQSEAKAEPKPSPPTTTPATTTGTTCQGPKGGGTSPPQLGLEPEEPKPKSQRKPRGNPDVGRVRDWWRERYRAEYGAEATWGGKQNGQARTLLNQHGLEEVLRRAEVLFTSPPQWLSGPYDFGTLVQHFDKLAQVRGGYQRPTNVLASDYRGNRGGDRNADHVERTMQEAIELERQGR